MSNLTSAKGLKTIIFCKSIYCDLRLCILILAKIVPHQSCGDQCMTRQKQLFQQRRQKISTLVLPVLYVGSINHW